MAFLLHKLHKSNPTQNHFLHLKKGYSGLYIIRENTIAGATLKKSLYVDGQYIGETAKGTYFYRLVKPGVHTLQTESEFSENGISVNFNEGENLTFEQKLKFGVFVGGAMLQQISKDEAIQLMQECTRAKDKDDKTQNLSTADYSENKGSIPAPLVQK